MDYTIASTLFIALSAIGAIMFFAGTVSTLVIDGRKDFAPLLGTLSTFSPTGLGIALPSLALYALVQFM